MRDIISDVVKELVKEQTLKNGWGRDCPTDRSERGLIELWVAMVNKVRSYYMADVIALEKRVTELHDLNLKAQSEINKLSTELYQRTHEKSPLVSVPI